MTGCCKKRKDEESRACEHVLVPTLLLKSAVAWVSIAACEMERGKHVTDVRTMKRNSCACAIGVWKHTLIQNVGAAETRAEATHKNPNTQLKCYNTWMQRNLLIYIYMAKPVKVVGLKRIRITSSWLILRFPHVSTVQIYAILLPTLRCRFIAILHYT